MIIIRSRSQIINRIIFGNPFVSVRRFSCILYFHEYTKELELLIEYEVLQWLRAGWEQWIPYRQSPNTQQSPAKAAEGQCLQSRSLAGSAITPKLENRRLWLQFWPGTIPVLCVSIAGCLPWVCRIFTGLFFSLNNSKAEMVVTCRQQQVCAAIRYPHEVWEVLCEGDPAVMLSRARPAAAICSTVLQQRQSK